TAGMPAGTHTVIASETDAAGNTGTASLAITLGNSSSSAPPSSPPIGSSGAGSGTGSGVTAESLVSDTGTSSIDKITANVALKGTADPDAVLHFTVDGGALAATATANATGAWSFTPA